MIIELLAAVAVGVFLLPRRRSERVVYVDREPERDQPAYHPPMLPYYPPLADLQRIKHGHTFGPWTLRCACGMDITDYMMDHYRGRDICPTHIDHLTQRSCQ